MYTLIWFNVFSIIRIIRTLKNGQNNFIRIRSEFWISNSEHYFKLKILNLNFLILYSIWVQTHFFNVNSWGSSRASSIFTSLVRWIIWMNYITFKTSKRLKFQKKSLYIDHLLVVIDISSQKQTNIFCSK